MTSDELLKALSVKHADDVFVPECKDGPSQTRSHRRLDAWVLLKTWSPITAIGYEIKVDRKDWRRDNKLHDYMPLCHLLYVVAPKGLIPPEELPASVGLMESVGTNGRLQVKRKAARREIVLPAELMVYVLMCRTRVTRERYNEPDGHWRTEQLREWVKEKDEKQSLSYAVSEKIRHKFNEQEHRQRHLECEIEGLKHIERRIVEMGLDPHVQAARWKVESRLRALISVIEPSLLADVRRCAESLVRVHDDLERLRQPPQASADVELVEAQPPQEPEQ